MRSRIIPLIRPRRRCDGRTVTHVTPAAGTSPPGTLSFSVKAPDVATNLSSSIAQRNRSLSATTSTFAISSSETSSLKATSAVFRSSAKSSGGHTRISALTVLPHARVTCCFRPGDCRAPSARWRPRPPGPRARRESRDGGQAAHAVRRRIWLREARWRSSARACRPRRGGRESGTVSSDSCSRTRRMLASNSLPSRVVVWRTTSGSARCRSRPWGSRDS